MKIENRLIKSKNEIFNNNKKTIKSNNFFEIIQNLEVEEENDLFIDNNFNIKEEDIKNLAGLISQIGDDLCKNPDYKLFMKYKNSIKIFIKLIQKNYEVKETLSKINISKQKLFKTVDIIDQELHKLASLILNQEKNRIIYLNLINNIKGLIIDLIL